MHCAVVTARPAGGLLGTPLCAPWGRVRGRVAGPEAEVAAAIHGRAIGVLSGAALLDIRAIPLFRAQNTIFSFVTRAGLPAATGPQAAGDLCGSLAWSLVGEHDALGLLAV